MILFLHGQDDYRRLSRKRELAAEFRKKYSGIGIESFDCGNGPAALDDLGGFLMSESIFSTAKLAIIENAFEGDSLKLAKLLQPALASKSASVFIVEREKPPKALAFLLKPPVKAEIFEILKDKEGTAFARARGKALGLNISDAAAQFLWTVYQGNSWAVMTELEKLSALTEGSAGFIEKSDLDALDLEVAPDYWSLLNGLKSQDGRLRLTALERLFATNDPAPKIFNILSAQAGGRIWQMAEYDFAVKSGKVDYEEALLDFVLG